MKKRSRIFQYFDSCTYRQHLTSYFDASVLNYCTGLTLNQDFLCEVCKLFSLLNLFVSVWIVTVFQKRMFLKSRPSRHISVRNGTDCCGLCFWQTEVCSDWAGTTQREAATKAKTSATRRSPLMWLIGEISRDQSAVCSRHWPPQQVENKRETVQSADSDLTSTSRSLSANKSNAKLQKLTIMRAWRGCSNP